MKKALAFLLALVLTLGCFAGCKKTDTAPTNTTPTSTTEPTTETEPEEQEEPEEPDTVSVANPNGLLLEENGITYESLAQKAVVKTALAYWYRGDRAQYDDTRLAAKGAPTTNGTLYRWQSGVRKNPEDYTTQYNGYLNCAAFVHDVFWSALGIDLGTSYTGGLAAIDDARRVFQYIPTGTETAEERAAVKQTYYDTLKPGDIIVTRSTDGVNGHTMIYVGEAEVKYTESLKNPDAKESTVVYDCIHSSGSNYVYESIQENREKNGTVGKTASSHAFDPSSGRYVFTKLSSLTIIRPLNTFTGEVPQNTLNRLQYMGNVIAEKLSSHPAGKTVSPGDEITFTFSIQNKNTTPVTLSVRDRIPKYTTFVSSDNCTVDGQKLRWAVTIPAGETVTVSYVVKVNADAKPGNDIQTTLSYVGGISVICPAIYIGTTLTDAQQAALLAAIPNYENADIRGIALANAIYKDVLGATNLLPDDSTAVLGKIFVPTDKYFSLNTESNIYTKAVAPGLYGGRYMINRAKAETPEQEYQRFEKNRTRWITTDQLVAGDIILTAQNADGSRQRIFLYTGETFLNLDTFTYVEQDYVLPQLLSYNRFAIIRPSLMLDSKQ